MSDDLSKVDWNRPIEAYHEDGRVVPVELYKDEVQPDEEGDYLVHPLRQVPTSYFREDGKPSPSDVRWNSGWRIRNVAEPKGLISSETLPSDDIAKRMEALLREAVDSPDRLLADKARAIVALLEPVDADLVEARSIIADAFRDYSGDENDDSARMVEEGKMDDAGSVKRIVDLAHRLRTRALERDSREG